MSYDPQTYNVEAALPAFGKPTPKGYAPGTRFYRRTYRLVAGPCKGQKQARKRLKIRHGHQRCKHA